MRLTRLTDYAMNVATEMARTPGVVRNAEALATVLRLPEPTVTKILKAFRQAGLVEALRGRHGGYKLAVAPEQCSMLDVLQALDGPLTLTECAANHAACTRGAFCGTRRPMQTVQQWLGTHLQHLTLNDFLQPAGDSNVLEERLHHRWQHAGAGLAVEMS